MRRNWAIETRAQKSKAYYPFIDGLRAVAMLGVLLQHIFVVFKPEGMPLFLHQLSAIGYYGIDIFFVISGFLITGILVESFAGEIRLRRFYLRRFLKIFPQYFVLIMFVFALLHLTGSGKTAGFTEFLTYVFFVQNYTERLTTLLHTWTLAIEEHFYIFYPLVVKAVFHVTADEDRRRRVLIASCTGIMAGLILNRWGTQGADVLATAFHAPLIHQTTLFRVDALFMGVLLKLCEPYYRLWRSGPVALACFLLGTAGYWAIVSVPTHVLWVFMAAYAATAFLFLSAYWGFRPWASFLEQPWIRWLGRNSYGIYLWHWPLILMVAPMDTLIGMGPAIAVYLLLTLVFGVGTTSTIEKYFLNLRKSIAP